MEAASNSYMVAATAVFALASFVATFGYAVTGFGPAILFWFIFTIGDISGFMNCSACGVKDAAFFQAISLASVTPLLLWQSRQSIKKHANKLLLTAFIPATFIGTPVGQLLQKTARAEVVRLIVGVFILLISAFELFRLIKSRRTKGKTESNANDKHEEPPMANEVDLEQAIDHNTDSLEEDSSDNTPSTESSSDEEFNGKDTSASSIATTSLKEGEEDAFQPNHASGSKFWVLGFVLGFISGFLGGLTGIRSGPILIFFLHFSYPKPIIRSNIMIISCVNTYVRIVYYIIEHFTESEVEWFQKDLWYVYVSVIVAGLVGVPLGSWVEPKINQAQYNSIIVIALIVAGLMSIINGSIDISQMK